MHAPTGETSPHTPQEGQRGARRRFLTGMVTGGLLGSLVTGGISIYAHANRGYGGWAWAGHDHWGARHGVGDPEAAGERAEFVTDWLLSRIDATAEQRQQVQAVVQQAVKDLMQLHEQHQANRQAWLDTLAQPTVNREALDELRHTAVQRMERASERFVTALADIAEVLTPQQRTKLIELAARFHH
jgi:periplasmic protein CpxP/Spy